MMIEVTTTTTKNNTATNIDSGNDEEGVVDTEKGMLLPPSTGTQNHTIGNNRRRK
jgi:hypothetical protein